MRRRQVLPVFLVTASLALSAGCGNNSNPNIPTPTPTPGVTETFPGTISTNGAMTFPFTVSTAGFVTATLTTIGPDSTTLIGMSLGTYNNGICTVGVTLSLDKAAQGTSMLASVSAGGTLCLRMFDAGTITGPTTFSVDVSHP
ncbi:MAG TPA: hypothetical protein VJN96_06955 [Vicinamibacterales bacterium]|nr:hypothetical protein [Vicinamibacterales bacterium]